MTQTDESAGAEWTGPWANDAQRLFRMLREAIDADAPSGSEPAGPADPADAADAADPADPARSAGPAGSAHSPRSHASAAECRYCPLCQGLAMVRRNGPELLDRVAEFAAGLAATLRATGPAPDQGGDQREDHADGAGAAAGGDPAAGAAGSAWAASVDDVGAQAGQYAAGPAPQDRSKPGPPEQPLVPPMVRIDITD